MHFNTSQADITNANGNTRTHDAPPTWPDQD